MPRISFDFFQAQVDNKRSSFLFGLCFFLVMVAWSVLVYFIIKLLSSLFLAKYIPHTWRAPNQPFDPASLALTLILLTIIIFVSVRRISQIHNGGSTFIATKIGAIPSSIDGALGRNKLISEREKILNNIVSEISVAASISEPDLYILPGELGINALAAGLDQDDACIIVSLGALKYLDREELSALVAHEFSHIINGDMRHFTMMAGWLHGLFFLQMIARQKMFLFRSIKTVLLAGTMMALGALGSLFGRIIQAAFSRRRELLADASAAKFTRNPMALARVLKKIGGLAQGGIIQTAAVADLNHFFLAKPERSSAFSSHPPLADRIWLLDPQWDGWYYDFEENPVDFLEIKKSSTKT
ncbi:MAG: M48 family metalloprotease [Deltaproteobacteria bacterium]|jgi:Zn-dependent protease with chaperone function|nr:M48 family metalloprotease [Deltaproteobacteria bacterium]